ncbi:class I SAM-dependent methyltransferase [Sneathiella litorea]|uniref:Methyltransferase domain-containing protein n=1 Tax=Sneathiella litorea TaxID=2606216 RepID=A0A6L8W3E8_9PROT|nr:class I SAM-dependent methyltransferase [Sneathiella litorea]MZR29024.1 methyltransferase domain-containing protein [Sneathiella litorea]
MRPISPWIEKYAPQIPDDKSVLDIACGGGRHSLYLLDLGHNVTAVDIDTSLIAAYQGRAGLSIVQADLEKGGWPFPVGAFSGILVVNYLWRPLFADIVTSLAPGGILLYDTFAQGNEKYGRPKNPDFLLAPEELIDSFGGELDVIDFFEGDIEIPTLASRQSIAARKPL